MKKIILSLIILLILIPTVVNSHSGRTDSNGGHYDRSTGEYHYHNGDSVSYNSKASIEDYNFKILLLETEVNILESKIAGKNNQINILTSKLTDKKEKVEKLENDLSNVIVISCFIVIAVVLIGYYIGKRVEREDTLAKQEQEKNGEK